MTQVSHSNGSSDHSSKAKCALIIDQQPTSRKGLKQLILDATDYAIVLEAADTKQAQMKIQKGQDIDCIIAALDTSTMSCTLMIEGISALGEDIPFLIIADGRSREEILEIIDGGASGVIARTTGEEEIIRIVETIGNGAIHIASAAFGQATVKNNKTRDQQSATTNHQALANLTRRQNEVLEELSRAQSNKAIARNLDISENTVKIHVATILRTLGAENRTQAALIAQHRG